LEATRSLGEFPWSKSLPPNHYICI
jgi:hypothetical protein